MKKLKEKLHKGFTILATAGAYVPAVHCHDAHRAPSTHGEPAPQVAPLDGGQSDTVPAAPAAPDPEPEAPPAAPAAADGGASAEADPVSPAEPAAAAPAEAEQEGQAAPSDLPERPGAGSREECRFLEQIALAGLSRFSGGPQLAQVVNQTYARFARALGRVYQGEMSPEVDIVSLGPGLHLTVSYTPTSEPWAGRFDRILVHYRFEATVPIDGPVAPQRCRVHALGHRQGGSTEVLGSSRICQLGTSGDGRPEPCTYPRWNPQGLRYGLFDTITREDDA